MALGNYGTQRGGQGEAVILNPQSFYNNLAAENRYKRQQAAINDRIAAKQKADADKIKKDELYKMSSQTGGPARYLAPYAAQARQQLNERTQKAVDSGEIVNENALRLEYNAIDALEKQGLATGEDIDRRMVDLQKDQFIKGGPFIEAYRANLDEDVKKHLAAGKPYSTFVVDNNDLIKRSMADTRYDIYDPIAIGENIRKQYPVRTVQQPPKPGRATTTTKASPFFKTDPDTGIAIPELDYEKVNQAFNSPSFRPFVEQSFARELTNPDSFYFKQTSKNKEALKDDPEEFAAVQTALKKRYLENEILENTALTTKALPFDRTYQYTSRPSGGRGKQKEVVTGEGVFTNIKGMGRSTQIKDKPLLPDQQLLTYPVLTSTSKGTQKSIRLDAPNIDAINVGEDQIVKYSKIPSQSQVDIANPDYTVMPVLTEDITVDNFIDKDGKLQKNPKVFRKGSVIGQGDEFSSKNRFIIKTIVEAAKRKNGLEYKFGALIPTYTRQSKALAKDEQLAAQLEAKITGEPIEDIQRAYGAQKLGLFRGNYFFPRDFSKGSIFSQSWGAARNLYKGMTLEQIERDLRRQAIETLDSELGISKSRFVDMIKSTPPQAPVQNKKALDD
jgi:hypothetical protein